MRDLLPFIQENPLYALPTIAMFSVFAVLLWWLLRCGDAKEFEQAARIPLDEK